jgi:hypothetical protein
LKNAQRWENIAPTSSLRFAERKKSETLETSVPSSLGPARSILFFSTLKTRSFQFFTQSSDPGVITNVPL